MDISYFSYMKFVSISNAGVAVCCGERETGVWWADWACVLQSQCQALSPLSPLSPLLASHTNTLGCHWVNINTQFGHQMFPWVGSLHIT